MPDCKPATEATLETARIYMRVGGLATKFRTWVGLDNQHGSMSRWQLNTDHERVVRKCGDGWYIVQYDKAATAQDDYPYIEEIECERQKLLDEAWEAYDKRASGVAEKQFNEVVKPFCQTKGYVFRCGNGSWWIGPRDNESCDEVPNSDKDADAAMVEKVLTQEVPGMPSIDLGGLMPWYEGEK
jgi:hypothetical protein